MKCPLLSIACAASQMPVSQLADECLKEECAWWDQGGQTCVTLSINFDLWLLAGAVGIVADKMPPERR